MICVSRTELIYKLRIKIFSFAKFFKEKTAIPSTVNAATSSLIGRQVDDDSDDDDDDGIQVTIGNIKSGPSIFPPNRQTSRTSMPRN